MIVKCAETGLVPPASGVIVRLVDMAGVALRSLEEWPSIVDEIDYKAEAGLWARLTMCDST